MQQNAEDASLFIFSTRMIMIVASESHASFISSRILYRTGIAMVSLNDVKLRPFRVTAKNIE
jgi:hypothetical protein